MEFLRNVLLHLRQRNSKVLVVLFCFLLVYIFVFTSPVIAAQPITVMFDGHPLIMDVPPIVRDGRTLVPCVRSLMRLGPQLIGMPQPDKYPHIDLYKGKAEQWYYTLTTERL